MDAESLIRWRGGQREENERGHEGSGFFDWQQITRFDSGWPLLLP